MLTQNWTGDWRELNRNILNNNYTMRGEIESNITMKNTPVVNNNVMYFNRGKITLLLAVLICDSGGHTHPAPVSLNDDVVQQN